jgi:DNA-binding transcriptional LysR family regulator
MIINLWRTPRGWAAAVGRSNQGHAVSALRYFLETARLGSIRRAAEILYVAPSGVSRQIALLEQTYRMPLFERHAVGVRLTVAGEVFARQAPATVRNFERLGSSMVFQLFRLPGQLCLALFFLPHRRSESDADQ